MSILHIISCDSETVFDFIIPRKVYKQTFFFVQEKLIKFKSIKHENVGTKNV